MYDMSKEIDKFLNKYVTLHAKEQNKLRKLKKVNITRLKKGLDEYNEENNSKYRIVDNSIQGSMAMHTVIQNEQKDYDIDVAIVFDDENLGNLNPLAIRKIVTDALTRKTKQFNTTPEIKTSCVRLHYEDGYHIDFAIFKRSKNIIVDGYEFEHSGLTWSKRDVKGVEEWFNINNEQSKGLLRKIVRLSKQFSSGFSNMPSGLIQTALCIECLNYNDRIDIAFYETLNNIYNRLLYNKLIILPFDGNRSLTDRKIDTTRIDNYKNHIYEALQKLQKLNLYNCSFEQAVEAWKYVFHHKYWDDLIDNKIREKSSNVAIVYDKTEEFIENKFIIKETYDVNIETKIIINGFRCISLEEYLKKYKNIQKGMKIECEYVDKDVKYDYILWKVKNEGITAKKRNDIRGQIRKRDKKITETAVFQGEHYIECYLIKNNECIGIGHVDIPIGVD